LTEKNLKVFEKRFKLLPIKPGKSFSRENCLVPVLFTRCSCWRPRQPEKSPIKPTLAGTPTSATVNHLSACEDTSHGGKKFSKMFELLKDIVNKEFGIIANKFETVVFCSDEKPEIENPYRGGVYIFFYGRSSLENW
jgi:hypothetical protein